MIATLLRRFSHFILLKSSLFLNPTSQTPPTLFLQPFLFYLPPQVTYFVTYGTAIVMYSYFVCVRSDYNFDSARERWNLRTFHKISRRNGFDHDKYNSIVDQMREVEANMTQLENVGALLNVKKDTNTM